MKTKVDERLSRITADPTDRLVGRPPAKRLFVDRIAETKFVGMLSDKNGRYLV